MPPPRTVESTFTAAWSGSSREGPRPATRIWVCWAGICTGTRRPDGAGAGRTGAGVPGPRGLPRVVEALERLAGAEDGQRVRVRPVERGVELVEGARRGAVAALLDPAQEPVALRADLVRRQPGLEGQLGGQGEQLAPEPREPRGADLRVGDVAGRAQPAAQPGDRLRELGTAVPGRPLDHHGVEEVRDPGGIPPLPARARADHERDGDDGRDRVLAHEDGEPVGERHAHDLAGRRGRRRREAGAEEHRQEPHRGTKRTRAYSASPRYLRAASWIWAAVIWRRRPR